MTFKDMIKSDADIFINESEFAEKIKINNEIYVGVISYPDDKKTDSYEGIVTGVDVVVSFKYQEEFLKYKIGSSILLNNVDYIINDIKNEFGILELYLLKNSSY